MSNGLAQNNEICQFTKEEAIATIRANYLFMYFRYPEDTITNINRLIENINEVVPVSERKSEKIKVLILSKIKQTEKRMSVNHILGLNRYDLPNFIPIMGINVNDVINDNFNYSDYERIYNRLVKDRIRARKAFNYLQRLYNEGRTWEDMIFINIANPQPFLNRIFDYFEI